MVWVVNAAGVGKDFGLEPVPYFRGWGEAYAEVREIRKLDQ